MLGRIIRVAALAGVGTMAYRWWRNRHEEDRLYSGTEPRSLASSSAESGAESPVDAPVDRLPAQ